MKLWNKNNISDIQDLLDYILSIWQANGGYSFTPKNNIAYHEFLSSIDCNVFNRSAAHRTLTQMKISSKITCAEYDELYFQIKEEIARQIIIKKKWTFYIPIDAEFEDGIKFPITFTILEKKYQFVNSIPYSGKLLSNLPFKLFDYQDEINNHIKNPKTKFLRVSANGQDWYSAWDDITPSFDVLRGIIEFSFGFRGFQISSQSKPRNKIPHPKWIIIRDQSNLYDGFRFNIQDYKVISKFKFSQKKLNVIKHNSRILQKIPSNYSSKRLLVSCLRLYSDAMDGYYHYNQFLSLWNIAEAICLSEDFGGESKKVAKRLAWFGKNIGLSSTGYSNILDTLSHKRNNLVHKGISEIDDEDVNHLKFAIDTALLWLYKSLAKLKTLSHLTHYYRIRDLNKTELSTINKTIKYINKVR